MSTKPLNLIVVGIQWNWLSRQRSALNPRCTVMLLCECENHESLSLPDVMEKPSTETKTGTESKSWTSACWGKRKKEKQRCNEQAAQLKTRRRRWWQQQQQTTARCASAGKRNNKNNTVMNKPTNNDRWNRWEHLVLLSGSTVKLTSVSMHVTVRKISSIKKLTYYLSLIPKLENVIWTAIPRRTFFLHLLPENGN